jgi:hypothetical protein
MHEQLGVRVRALPLEERRHRPMQMHAPRPRQCSVERLANERVSKVIALVVLVDDARRQAGLESGEGRCDLEPRDLARRLEVEALSRDRRRDEQALGARAEARHALAHVGEQILADPVALSVVLAERARHLLCIERVAGAERVHARAELLRCAGAEDVRHDGARRVGVEPLEVQSLAEALALERAEQRVQRRADAQILLAHGPDEQERQLRTGARQVVKELQAGLVGVVQIFDEEVQGRAGGQRRDGLLDVVEQPQPVFLCRGARHRAEGEEGVVLRTGAHLAEPVGPGVDERRVRRGALEVVSDAAEHGRPTLGGEARAFEREPRLADPRLADQDQRAGAPRHEARQDVALAATTVRRTRRRAAREPPRQVRIGVGARPARRRRRGRDLALLDAPLELEGFGAGLAVEPIAQRLGALGELSQRIGGTPGARERDHEAAVCLFLRGIDVEEPAQDADVPVGITSRLEMAREPQRSVDETLAQRLAPREPRVAVRIAGQELAVEAHGLGQRRGVVACGRLLEGAHVHLDLGGEPHHPLVERGDLEAHRGAQIVQRAVEVVGRRFEILFGPEPIEQLFAVKRVTWRQPDLREELDRATPVPPVGRDLGAVDLDREATEKLQACGGPRHRPADASSSAAGRQCLAASGAADSGAGKSGGRWPP